MKSFFEKVFEVNYNKLKEKALEHASGMFTAIASSGEKNLNNFFTMSLAEQRYNVTKNKIELTCFSFGYGYYRLWLDESGVVKKEKAFLEDVDFENVLGTLNYVRTGIFKNCDLITNKCNGYIVEEVGFAEDKSKKFVFYDLNFKRGKELTLTNNFGDLPEIFFERVTPTNLAQLLVKEAIKLKGYSYNDEGDLFIEYYINKIDV